MQVQLVQIIMGRKSGRWLGAAHYDGGARAPPNPFYVILFHICNIKKLMVTNICLTLLPCMSDCRGYKPHLLCHCFTICAKVHKGCHETKAGEACPQGLDGPGTTNSMYIGPFYGEFCLLSYFDYKFLLFP